YGDIFGEAFTANLCRAIEITPTPAPSLTKMPADQGPVPTGSSVTWTMSYGNTGTVALSSSVIQDTLPPGFSYVSSSSSPSLGAPSAIRAAGGTSVRWNAGTIPASTASQGTVTIPARAGPPTGGSGTPPQQTFTNRATLTGRDPGGTTFSTSASADV